MISNILVVVGVIALSIVFLYYTATYLQGTKQEDDVAEPSQDEEYMEKVGAVCPSGWVYLGKKGRRNICQNYYNIPVPDECYDDKDTKQKSFKAFKDWGECEQNGCRELNERCNWVKKCGLKSHMSVQTNSCPSSPDIQEDSPYYSWIVEM